MPARKKLTPGRVVDCPHTRSRHTHGTVGAYNRDGCRCLECRAAAAAHARQRRRNAAYGRTAPAMIDASRARTHVQALRDAGLSLDVIARAAGVGSTTLATMIYGQPHEGSSPKRFITPDTEAKILRTTAGSIPPVLRHDMPAIGARRRVQALRAIGYPLAEIARHVGMRPTNLGAAVNRSALHSSTHAKVAAAYDTLAMRPKTASTPTEAGIVRKTVEHAARQGWAPPLAWDDETIDDPKTKPQGHALAA